MIHVLLSGTALSAPAGAASAASGPRPSVCKQRPGLESAPGMLGCLAGQLMLAQPSWPVQSPVGQACTGQAGMYTTSLSTKFNAPSRLRAGLHLLSSTAIKGGNLGEEVCCRVADLHGTCISADVTVQVTRLCVITAESAAAWDASVSCSVHICMCSFLWAISARWALSSAAMSTALDRASAYAGSRLSHGILGHVLMVPLTCRMCCGAI